MKRLLLTLTISTVLSLQLQAQTNQPNRLGQSGAGYLLMNGTANSSGFNGLNIGSVDGIESSVVNPAGLSTTQGTELTFAHTRWLIGTGIAINNIGFSQALGEEGTGGVIGISINSLNLGEFIRTTADQPDGDIGSFSPNMTTIGLSYAKKFTDHILVGATLRGMTESTNNLNAFGVCFDAGVQYRALENDALKLGIALRNVGPAMSYTGQGLEYRAPLNPNNPSLNSAVTIPTDKFELPSQLSLGGSYDIRANDNNTITMLAGFISNSYYYNQLGLGAQYKFKDIVAFRASYLYENGIWGDLGMTKFSAYTGLAAGATFQVPFKASKKSDRLSKLGIDFSYRTTISSFGGTMSVGARVDL